MARIKSPLLPSFASLFPCVSGRAFDQSLHRWYPCPNTHTPSHTRRPRLHLRVSTDFEESAVDGRIPPMRDVVVLLAAGSALLTLIDQRYGSLPSLQADFEQRTTSVATAVVKVENGRFWMDRKSEVLRFDYEDPEEKIFLYARGRVEFYVPSDRQLTRYAVDEGADMAPFLFLLGKRRLSECLSIGVGTEKPVVPTNQLLHLQPVMAASRDVDFFIEAGPADGTIHRVIFFDSLRNRIEILLTRQRRLDRLPSGMDRLLLPPGTDIIEQP